MEKNEQSEFNEIQNNSNRTDDKAEESKEIINNNRNPENKLQEKLKIFLNTEPDSIILVKFLVKVKKHLMNLLGNMKQDIEFYTLIKENIDTVMINIEQIILFYNKIFSEIKSKKFGSLNDEDVINIIKCYVKLGEMINFLFKIYSNNIFLKLSYIFFTKIYKSFLGIQCNKSKRIISFILYESMINFINIITNKKIEFIDKFKDAKINYQMIKTISKALDFICILAANKNIIKSELLEISHEKASFPNISDIYNYLLVSRTNIFSLNVYMLFEGFSNTFYQILRKLIFVSSAFYGIEKLEEIKSVLKINLFKLLEISRIKDDLKNSIEDSQHEFYLDSLNLYIKITKLIIKNFYKYDILNPDDIKDQICRFMIELSFWDSLDVVENTCKFFVLLWKISIKHKVFMRSEMEKIIDYLFLRRLKTYINFLNDSEESLIKLSVLEIIINYLNILVREHQFVFVIFMNFDFCKIRFNLLSEILVNCQKYFDLISPIYTHLKNNVTILYLNIFEIIYDIIVNGNTLFDREHYMLTYFQDKESCEDKIPWEKELIVKIKSKQKNRTSKVKNSFVSKKIKNNFASDIEETEKIHENTINKKHLQNIRFENPTQILIGHSEFTSGSSALDEEIDTDNLIENSISKDRTLDNKKLADSNLTMEQKEKNKFYLDYNFVREIQGLQDLWNDEILAFINSNNSNFKKFNNKINPLFGLKPIETVNSKKTKEKKKQEELSDTKDSSKTGADNKLSNEDFHNTSNISNSSENVSSTNIELDTSSEKSDGGLSETKSIKEEMEKLNFIEALKAKNYRRLAYTIAILMKYSLYIDVDKIHEIFGNKNEFSKLILEEYLKTFDFRGMDILKAYRIYVSTFKLTGESDIIYNMIMAFSEKYYNDNQNDLNLRSVDEVSTLAYSILMLNTDLHDPNIKEHMSIDDFSKNVYTTKIFDHISKSYLENIYKSISTNAFKVPCPRNEDYSKTDEVLEVLKSKRNFIKNKIELYELSKKNEIDPNKQFREEELFISDYNYDNTQKFIFDIFNYSEKQHSNENTLQALEGNGNPLGLPKIKRNLNFPLFNICESFNLSIFDDNILDKNSIINDKNFELRNKIFFSMCYLLWEDVFYNFMGISSKFYEQKDENVIKIFDTICLISQSLNKRDNIDKLIMTIHSLINSGKYEKKNLAQLYNIFFSISINYSKNFNSFLEIYFSSILDIIKHKIFKNESDLQEDYKSIIESQIEKSFAVINNKKNKKIANNSLFNYLFTRPAKENNESGLQKYKEHILNHLKISDALTANNSDEDFFELKRILEIIRTQDEEFIFFVSLAASKILDYNSKAEHYYSLIFLNEILNENLNEKEFMKIWQNLFNIFINKMEFKHIFDKEENLFEILFFNYFFNLIIRRFSHLIETDDYIQLLSNYSEIENSDILYYFMENNDLIHINQSNILDCDKKNFSFDCINDIEEESSYKLRKENKEKIILLNNVNSKLVKKDIPVELNVLLLFKLINYYSQNFLNSKTEIQFLEKLKNTFKFMFRILSNIKDFNEITLDTLVYIHNTFKLLQENNFICVYLIQKPDYPDIFYSVVKTIVPKLLCSLPNIDDQKWHFYLSVLNTLINTLLIENEKIQANSFECLKNLFDKIKIPFMILKEVLNILASYFNGMRLCNYKHPMFWLDLFTIFKYIFLANEEIVNNENEMTRLWQIYVKGFLDNYRQTKKNELNLTAEIDTQVKSIIKDTLDFIYRIVKSIDKSPNWWEANKNFLRLYFSDLINVSN